MLTANTCTCAQVTVTGAQLHSHQLASQVSPASLQKQRASQGSCLGPCALYVVFKKFLGLLNSLVWTLLFSTYNRMFHEGSL